MMMKHKSLFIFFSILFLTVLTTPIVSKGKDDAPGQSKKEEQSENKSNKGNKPVIVGTVDEITGKKVVVEDKAKNKTDVEIEQDTKVIRQTGKEKKLGTIKLKDIIAAVKKDKDATEGGNIKVKKIFVKEASNSAQLKRRAVMGIITEINGDALTVAHQIHRDRLYTVIINEQTVIKFKSDTNSDSDEATESADTNNNTLAIGQRIAAVGDLNEGGGIIAKMIHIIPGKATGVFKKNPIATPSATIIPTATPSSEISPTVVP